MPASEFAAVLVRARTGDADAFACLFRSHQPLLLRYVRGLGAADVAEDVAAETWMAVVRGLGDFDGEEREFRAWLVTVARNRLVDLRRAQARRPVVPVADLPDGPPGETDAAEDVVSREGTRWALALVATLPPDQAEAVLLRVVVGLDTAEVAEVMGRTSGAVRVLTHRGLRTLQARLDAPAPSQV
ncbi:MAG TPA: RNA polymerase sigma factor [Actinomycetes bacterium]|nr:RNA polymerase sigma factor [Actinomycetes bacterium]